MSTKIYANAKFALRADTLANWETKNPILEKGEPAVVTDGTESEKIKFGDGITRWKNLPYTKGPKGDKGNQGEQGPQGIQGEKGEPGDITNLVQNAGASDTHAISQKGVTELTAPLREGLGDAIYSKSINLFDCNWALKQDAEGNYENIKIAAWLRATGAENTTLNASKNYGYTGYIAIESNTKYTLGFAKYGDKIPTSELPWNSSDVIGVCFYSDADAT